MILFVVPAKLGSSQVNDEYKTHLIASFVVIPNVPFNSNVFGAFITTMHLFYLRIQKVQGMYKDKVQVLILYNEKYYWVRIQ